MMARKRAWAILLGATVVVWAVTTGLSVALAGKAPSPMKEEEADRALRSVPADPQALITFARSLREEAEQSESTETLLQALQAYGKVLENDPGNTEALEVLASTALETGAPDKAASYYERYLKLRPDDVQATTKYALSLIQNNAPEKGLEVLQKIIHDEPQLFPPRLALALAYRLLGREAEAKREAEAAAKLAPDDTARNVVQNFLKEKSESPD